MTGLQITGGRVFVEVYAENGTLSPQIAFGGTDEISMTTDVEKAEHYNTESANQVLDGNAVVSKNVGISFTTADITPAMIARAYLATSTTLTQTAATDEAQVATAVTLGGRVNLGYRNVTSVVVKSDDDLITYEEGTDYEFVSKAGYIVIVDGGNIAEGVDLNLTVTAPAGESILADAMKLDSLEVRLTYSGDASVGDSHEYIFEKVVLNSSGDTSLKSKEFTTISFEGSALKVNGKFFTVEIF